MKRGGGGGGEGEKKVRGVKYKSQIITFALCIQMKELMELREGF